MNFFCKWDHITTFESAWRFQEGEQIFVHDDQTKETLLLFV